MMEIELSPKALRQWKKLQRDNELFTRIDEALDRIASNPKIGKMLGGEFKGIRSYRVGSWRVLYEVYREHR
ncbi:MAG: type II toxin-antitoxin system RelE/ParE family toxin [Candidatus Electryoneaceae bacterium]|nr:type II toxin-antitoxin system RelE/ParE family toxin [Candidatus Electryoneaceae bacterium]